ncbi:MAG TPA: hypothetical protein PKD72_03255, partial [Gemmatales bacterium]|nr:hypothetical protein [Gemmatales bacterium]
MSDTNKEEKDIAGLTPERDEEELDLDFARELLDEHDRIEAEKPEPEPEQRPERPIDRLIAILARLSKEFGSSPPPEGESNELTDEDKIRLRKALYGDDSEKKQPTGWCPCCSMPTTIRDGSVLQCKLGHRYSVAEEVHVPPSDAGDVMDDID